MDKKLERVLESSEISKDGKEEIKSANKTVKELEAIANFAASEGGKVLIASLKERCRDLLVAMINAKDSDKKETRDKVFILLSDFAARLELYQTLTSANKDYDDAWQRLEEHIDQILEED